MEDNLLVKFEEIILSKRYLFHLHTDYTDGKCSVEDYCRWASEKSIEAVIFTEHVRRKLSYDFNELILDVQSARNRFPELDILLGVEAKVLPGGDLDIPDEIITKIQIVCFACHSFPNDVLLYEKSLRNLFSASDWKDKIRVWVHPGRFLKRAGFLPEKNSLLRDLLTFALSQGIFIEKNYKENLPPERLVRLVPVSSLVIGYDAHSLEELEGNDGNYGISEF